MQRGLLAAGAALVLWLSVAGTGAAACGDCVNDLVDDMYDATNAFSGGLLDATGAAAGQAARGANALTEGFETALGYMLGPPMRHEWRCLVLDVADPTPLTWRLMEMAGRPCEPPPA